MHNIEIPHKNKSLSLFHLNACSLNKNFDDLQHLLSCTRKTFDIIAIIDTRIIKNISLLNNLNINNYYIISLSCHEQVCLSGLRFERYFSHHRAR